ncbi:MAG: alpha/beta hydrolase [Chitinophagaceae bacterium]
MYPHRYQLTANTVSVQNNCIYSLYLERYVEVDFYFPPIAWEQHACSLLLINDGQDLPVMNFENIFNNLYQQYLIEPIIAVGIRCSSNRHLEYGTAYSASYENKGSLAGLYTKFVFDELIPYIRRHLNMPSFKEKAFAGFSLGGLSALDIVWNHASEFSKVGVFSGSLWWRRKAYDEGYSDENDRLMHLQVRKGHFYPWLQFFLQCGALDETADRNANGIIDSIDDTLDLIMELKLKGYTNQHIHYLLLEDGEHTVTTWGCAFPAFLQWGWGLK